MRPKDVAFVNLAESIFATAVLVILSANPAVHIMPALLQKTPGESGRVQGSCAFYFVWVGNCKANVASPFNCFHFNKTLLRGVNKS